MRYTTLIDITEMRQLYANHNVRLVYLHMALKAGYHDDDRDLLRISLRSLAADVGVSVSAVRNAVDQLTKAGLLSRVGDVWQVRKWVVTGDITPRAKTKREAAQIERAVERMTADAVREREAELQRIQRERNFASGKTSYMLWYEAQEAKARAGDEAARRTVEAHRRNYEQQLKLLKEQQ